MKSFNPSEPEQSDVECSLCGQNGTPPPNCGTCHGQAETQPRGYTLSDLRTGRAKLENRVGIALKLKEYNPFPEGDSK